MYNPGSVNNSYGTVKVKCTLVQALRFYTGRTAHTGSRSIALLFHDHSTRKWWVVSVTPWPLFAPGKDPVPIVQDVGWAPGPVWIGAENLAPPGFDPWTIQPVVSCYTDWATRPTKFLRIFVNSKIVRLTYLYARTVWNPNTNNIQYLLAGSSWSR